MILVTGGTGFLGAHLLFHLINKGENIRAIYRNTSNLDLVKKIFSYYTDNKNLFEKIEWVKADILDFYDVSGVLKGVSRVYHAAAGVSYDLRDKDKIYNINVTGTSNIVNACLQNNIEKLCYVSSIAALGEAVNDEMINEKTMWQSTDSNSGYSISKFNAELEVWRGITEGLNTVIINPSVILGYNNWDKGSSALFKKIYNGFKYYTKGYTGFVDVTDVCKIMIQLMESDIVNEAFILSSENVCYKNLFEMIAGSINVKPPAKYATTFLTGLVWKLDLLRSRIAGKQALLTKESARTSHKKLLYSNKKIMERFKQPKLYSKACCTFKPVAETIKLLGESFIEEKIKNA